MRPAPAARLPSTIHPATALLEPPCYPLLLHPTPTPCRTPWPTFILAVGCAALGQLLVWEWRSETYVLKQQGHHHDVAATAFSPDGALVATGADDCKVRVY